MGQVVRAASPRPWFVGVLLLTVIALVAPLAAATETAGGPATQIVGGRQTKPGKFPFMTYVQVETNLGFAACGGSLIARRYVLTAAHCVVDDAGNVRPPDAFRVAVGATDIRRADPRGIRGVTAVTAHPEFDRETLTYDAAVLRLDRPVRAFGAIRLVKSGEDRYEDPRDPVVVAGWGARRTGGAPVTTLRDVALSISSDQLCANRMADYGYPFDATLSLCASGRGVDSCQGDSGGPLMAKAGKREFVAIGLVSYGPLCALQGYPAAYTRLSNPDINAFVRAAAGLGRR